MLKDQLIPPLSGDAALPEIAVFLCEPMGGHWKYTKNLLEGVQTPCLLITSKPMPQEKHWCLPALQWSRGPHKTITAKAKLMLIHFWNIIRLLRIVDYYEIRMIHFQSFEPISMGILLPFLRYKARLLFSVHNVLPHSYYSGYTKLIEVWFRKRIFSKADQLFVFSRYGEEKLSREFNIPEKKVAYLPMGCHEPVPDPEPLRNDLPDQPTFLMFGGYRQNKGFEILRDAFLEAKSKGLPGRLLIAGSYPADIESYTLSLFRKADLLDSVLFKNEFIPEDQIDGIFRSADLIVLPYTAFESQSGIVFLAYAYNLPLIASRVGGLTEVLESDGTGILVTPGSVEDLSEALFLCLEKYREFIDCQPARLLSTKYSWSHIGKATDQVYARLASTIS